MEAACGSVQRHLVIRVQIDALDNVYLAVVWPEGALRPERRPNGAAVGEVQCIDDPETAVVVEVLGRDADLGRVMFKHLFPETTGILTVFRLSLFATLVVLSTLMMAFPAVLMYARFCAVAADWFSHHTSPMEAQNL